jgi:tetratricopeptide (TPR) repeat protein
MISLLAQDDLKADKAETLFIEAYVDYMDGDHESSNKKFTRIYEKFSKDPIGAIAAYNIACNYSLEGETAKALEWVKKALDAGYDNFEHLETDGDLQSARDEKKFDEMLAEAKKKAPKEKRATIKPEDAKAFAEKLAKAHADADSQTRQALNSRLGWFHHAKTIEWLNAELKAKKLRLVGEGGSVQLEDAPD